LVAHDAGRPCRRRYLYLRQRNPSDDSRRSNGLLPELFMLWSSLPRSAIQRAGSLASFVGLSALQWWSDCRMPFAAGSRNIRANQRVCCGLIHTNAGGDIAAVAFD
jgi:hypothetical protein